MANMCIKIDDQDMNDIKRKAHELRIPPTIFARSLIIQGMRNVKNTGEQMNEK